jgi:glycosyltransferase involved in cell wall biosynthesis
LGQGNGLVLTRREAHVLAVIDDANALFELAQNDGRTVLGGIIDHDHFVGRVVLLEDVLETAANESSAVVRNDSDGDHRASITSAYPRDLSGRSIALALEYHLLKKEGALLRRVMPAEWRGRLRRRARAVYLLWDAREYNRQMAAHLKRRQARYGGATTPGLLSIVTPVWDGTPLPYFRALAETIIQQNAEGHGEWVVLNNGCRKGELLAYFEELKRHPWVAIHESPENAGIIGGLRLCLERARGRYILPVDADDWLYPDCLDVVSWWVRETGFPPLLYTDEDKRIGTRAVQPYLKPDFDPVLLLNSAYIAHLGVIDRGMALELGAYSDKNTEGSADWDLFIRFFAAGKPAVHIPEVVYGWRMHPESTADDALSKPYIHSSQRAVLQRYLDLRGIAEDYTIDYTPLVKGTADWWMERKHTRPRAAVMVVLGTEPSAETLVKAPDYPDLTRVALPVEAGLSALQEIAGEDLACLVSEDLRIDRDDWLWDAVSLFEKHPDTVMVGGRIRNIRGEILSAGLVFGFEGGVGCPDAGRPAIDPGYFAQMFKQHSVSAVSSQFAVIRASFLRELPADASIRFLGAWAGALALRSGQRIVYSPFLSAVSSVNWEAPVTAREREAFQKANRDILPDSRYYSRYLGTRRESTYKPSFHD